MEKFFCVSIQHSVTSSPSCVLTLGHVMPNVLVSGVCKVGVIVVCGSLERIIWHFLVFHWFSVSYKLVSFQLLCLWLNCEFARMVVLGLLN